MSPEVIVGALAGLTRLRSLCIEFTWLPAYQFRDDSSDGSNSVEEKLQSPHSPSLVRAVFPALSKFQMGGDSEYLEDLVALIDAPRLEDLSVEYPMRYDDPNWDYDDDDYEEDSEEGINAENLSQFISRTASFKHAQFRRAEMTLNRHIRCVEFDLPLAQGECQQAYLCLKVLDEENSQIESPCIDTAFDLIHVLGQLTVMLSDVQHLSIKGVKSEDRGLKSEDTNLDDEDTDLGEDTDLDLDSDWLPVLRSFPAVDVLHVSWELAGQFTSALANAPKMAAEVLPGLKVLWLDDQDERRKGKLMVAAEQFLSLRKQSGHPVVIVNSRDQLVERLDPHQLELSKSP